MLTAVTEAGSGCSVLWYEFRQRGHPNAAIAVNTQHKDQEETHVALLCNDGVAVLSEDIVFETTHAISSA